MTSWCAPARKLRYHGAFTPSAWLPSYRLAGDSHLERSASGMDMAESHVVSALARKRAEIAGMIARAQQQLGQSCADPAHVDATIRLFLPQWSRRRSP
jgi:hypothetical protein